VGILEILTPITGMTCNVALKALLQETGQKGTKYGVVPVRKITVYLQSKNSPLKSSQQLVNFFRPGLRGVGFC
jgi:hypothetical protein